MKRKIHNVNDDLGDTRFDPTVQFDHGFLLYMIYGFDCPENYINSFFMHEIYLPKLFVFTLIVELFDGNFAEKTHLFTHARNNPVGRSWEKPAKNIVVSSEFISSLNQKMVD